MADGASRVGGIFCIEDDSVSGECCGTSMRNLFTLGLLAFVFTGCGSLSIPKEFRTGYTDKSETPVTKDEAWAIAKREVRARDHFADEPRERGKPSKFITGQSTRIDDGKWRVIARAVTSENAPDGGWGAAYLPGPAVVVTIDGNRNVVGYNHYTNEEVDAAVKFSAANRKR